MEKVREAATRIQRMEVQGATNVALTALNAVVDHLKSLDDMERDTVLHEITEAKELLFASRETEPFMRNAIRFVEWSLKQRSWTPSEFPDLVQGISDEFVEAFREARRKITEVGKKRIIGGSRVLTHCHSSAVSEILRTAREDGVNFELFITETRPRYQGRITAREMAEAGVKATMLVDSAVRTFLKRVDLVLVGSDAITSEGNVINKIGTSLIALAAQEARTPFYVATELFKFDPQTIHGDFEVIEERSPDEVWADPPEDLTIRNPAFDVTRRDYIHGIICEEGVISPHTVVEAVRRRYPWILEASGL
ncbi:MAG: S-methyl-5-thioribose-1-phosphate isomerase [Gemmatimonadetes bacterium]|nr:S-methyl-5-thioribose-1-phosphate isomerase [Gemmatimonadota bacterium]